MSGMCYPFGGSADAGSCPDGYGTFWDCYNGGQPDIRYCGEHPCVFPKCDAGDTVPNPNPTTSGGWDQNCYKWASRRLRFTGSNSSSS